jgi:hypothetical protein
MKIVYIKCKFVYRLFLIILVDFFLLFLFHSVPVM